MSPSLPSTYVIIFGGPAELTEITEGHEVHF